jgi:hypothetical protein
MYLFFLDLVVRALPNWVANQALLERWSDQGRHGNCSRTEVE